MSKKSKFSEEFKREAVRLALQGEKTQAEIANDLGISAFTLSQWKSRVLSNGGADAMNLSPQAELKRVQRELAIVREERDILKKAMAVFSKPRR